MMLTVKFIKIYLASMKELSEPE